MLGLRSTSRDSAELREAVANQPRRSPSLAGLHVAQHSGQDGLAGLNSALSSVPDGMASGLLAGVNPIYGLYACMVGPIVGGIFSSTRLMVVATTSASALAAGQTLSALPPGPATRQCAVRPGDIDRRFPGCCSEYCGWGALSASSPTR